jgi:hypothetical protein
MPTPDNFAFAAPKTCGLTEITFMLADINPDGSAGPAGFTGLDSALYFSANNGIHGRELWKTILLP